LEFRRVLFRSEKNESWQPEFFRGPKGGRGKMLHQETLWRSRHTRFNACRWKTNCCGIFCASQEGGEGTGKISHHLSSQNRVSRGRHVRVLRSIQKRILCFRS